MRPSFVEPDGHFIFSAARQPGKRHRPLSDAAVGPWTSIVLTRLSVLVIAGLGVFWAVIHVIAAVKAIGGVWYSPPLCWQFLK